MLSFIVDNFMNFYKNEIYCIYLFIYYCDIIGIIFDYFKSLCRDVFFCFLVVIFKDRCF